VRVTKQEVEEIMLLPKRVTQYIGWKADTNKESIYEFSIPIECDIPGRLYLKGNINRKLIRFSFVILYNNYRIKALDIGKTHKNCCPKHGGFSRIGTKHKHSWQDCCKDGWAYEPDDITTGAPIEQVFEEFLKECNIKYNYKLPSLPSEQLRLWII